MSDEREKLMQPAPGRFLTKRTVMARVPRAAEEVAVDRRDDDYPTRVLESLQRLQRFSSDV